MFNPVVRWNIDANTWVRVSDQYQQNSFNQDQFFIPYYNNSSRFGSVAASTSGPQSPYDEQQNFTEVTWHHDFNKDWSIQQTAYMMNLRNNWQDNGGTSYISDCITPGGPLALISRPPTTWSSTNPPTPRTTGRRNMRRRPTSLATSTPRGDQPYLAGRRGLLPLQLLGHQSEPGLSRDAHVVGPSPAPDPILCD